MMAALLPRWTEITMTVAGLPLHPLVVHAAVVLVPLAALALIATGWRASLRARFGAPLAIAAVVGWLAAFVASQSGDALAEEIEDLSRKAHDAIEGHEESGELAMITTLLFTLGAIALWAAQRYAGRLPTWAPTGRVRARLARRARRDDRKDACGRHRSAPRLAGAGHVRAALAVQTVRCGAPGPSIARPAAAPAHPARMRRGGAGLPRRARPGS